MKKFVSAFSKMASGLSKVAGIMLLAMSIIVCIHVILRGLYNGGILVGVLPGGVTGVYELVQYGMLIIVSLTLAENELTGGNIIVNFILDKMKPRIANLLSIIMYFFTIIGMTYVLINQISMVKQKLANGAVTGVLGIPHWILVLFICIGLFFFIVAFIIRVYNMFVERKNLGNEKLTADDIAASMKANSEF